MVKFPNGFGINLKGVRDVLSVYQSSFWHTDSSHEQGCVSRKTNKKIIPSWARWCTLLMPVLKTQKQEYLCELKAKLVYMMSAKPDGITK